MLQQILRDMYIEPELLAELSDEQRQILFVKMREEQVRRWLEWDAKLESEKMKQPQKMKKPGKKKTTFATGHDGNDWVWVMGCHPDDLSIEEILEKEAQEKAVIQAEKEGEELRKQEEQKLKKKMDEERKKLEQEKAEWETSARRKAEEAALYQSLKEARLMAEKLEEERKEEEEKMKKLEEEEQVQLRNSKETALQMKSQRSSELYMSWREMRNILDKKAEESSKEVEASWKERERRSKEAESQMREIARRAREEYRRSLKSTSKIPYLTDTCQSLAAGEKPPVPPKRQVMATSNSQKRTAVPQNKLAVIKWFEEEEKPKGTGMDPQKEKVASWFHGIINRKMAEELLSEKPAGTFLVRVSERIWGYTISYQAKDRCKHFLIDATDGCYKFFGENYQSYPNLADLINYHMTEPITVCGEEKLLYPCGQEFDPPDYWDLFHDDVSKSTSL